VFEGVAPGSHQIKQFPCRFSENKMLAELIIKIFLTTTGSADAENPTPKIKRFFYVSNRRFLSSEPVNFMTAEARRMLFPMVDKKGSRA
jgi:hypothetical protein